MRDEVFYYKEKNNESEYYRISDLSNFVYSI